MCLADGNAQRARAYAASAAPVGTPLAGPEGNPSAGVVGNYGCPVFSGGSAWIVEAMLPDCKDHVLDWVQEVALDEQYANPDHVITYVENVNDEDGRCVNGRDGSEEVATAGAPVETDAGAPVETETAGSPIDTDAPIETDAIAPVEIDIGAPLQTDIN